MSTNKIISPNDCNPIMSHYKHNKTVLLVINCLQGGGAERSVLTLGKGFIDAGYEVHILRFNSTVAYKLDKDIKFHFIDYKPYRLLPKKIRFIGLAKVVDRYVKKEVGTPLLTLSNLDRSDRIMRYSQLPNIAHIIRNTISKKIEINSQTDNQWSVNKMKNIYSLHPCICISHGVELDLRQTLGITNSTTIFNPIDSIQINILSTAFQPEFENFIVHVGSFKVQKAHDVLIKAYSKTSMSLPLVLIGEGGQLEVIKNLVNKLKISNNVHFIGFKENPYPYIKQANFMVLSSNFEGFGRVIAEAMALDTPVISTNCPSGPSELLPPLNLVEVGDVYGLTRKIEEAMTDATSYHIPLDEGFVPSVIAKQYIEFMKLN